MHDGPLTRAVSFGAPFATCSVPRLSSTGTFAWRLKHNRAVRPPRRCGYSAAHVPAAAQAHHPIACRWSSARVRAVLPVSPAPSTDLLDYYRRRAATYERVYLKPERQDDLRAMEAWVGRQFAGRRVLELACGTGWWTPHGARNCASWLATDLNPETLAIAREKPLPPGKVAFASVDAYTLDGVAPAAFDGVFAGCWWSHVPLAQLASWLERLHARLAAGARVVFLDNRFVPDSSLPIARRDDEGNTYQLRRLDDGSKHEVLKNFPTSDQVQAVAAARARDFTWTAWTHYWAASWTLA